MFRDVMQVLLQAISGEAALAHVAEIARFHRIQASPGYRQAAEYVRDELTKAQVQAEILSFPANRQTCFWGVHMFQEWDVSEATCYLVSGDGPDRRLADYRDNKISIIQRSSSGDVETEIVAIDGGNEEADYAGLDLSGKVALVRQMSARTCELAVKQRGAAGILYDGMRKMTTIAERIDYPDDRQYTSVWQRGGGGIPTMGFVLTPRQGDEIRALIKQRQREGKLPLKARLHVRSVFYDGCIEVVSAFIPGATEQEIVLEAHLCHPQESANDNASGSAVLLEIARALQAAIRAGKLPPPRRGIRFLWIPEIVGTYAYLASHEADIPKMVAGINLDMVGEDQDKCRNTLRVVRPPMAMASFVPAVLEWCLRQYRDLQENPYSAENWSTFRVTPVPFSSGSDHYITSDPTVGIPSPMLNCYPDKYWHTSADTIDKVDPKVLGFSANLTAAYAWWLATAGDVEARWLADEMCARFKRDVITTVQDYLTVLADTGTPQGPSLQARVEFLAECQEAALNTLRRLSQIDPGPWQQACAAFAEAELTVAKGHFGGTIPERPVPAGEWEARAAAIIPKRVLRGPARSDEWALSDEDKETLWRITTDSHTADLDAVLAMYWTDGQRNLQKICDLVELEVDRRPTKFLVKYYELAARGGAIEL